MLVRRLFLYIPALVIAAIFIFVALPAKSQGGDAGGEDPRFVESEVPKQIKPYLERCKTFTCQERKFKAYLGLVKVQQGIVLGIGYAKLSILLREAARDKGDQRAVASFADMEYRLLEQLATLREQKAFFLKVLEESEK